MQLKIEIDKKSIGGRLKTEHGFVINPLRTVFYGVCTDCAGRQEKTDD